VCWKGRDKQLPDALKLLAQVAAPPTITKYTNAAKQMRLKHDSFN